MGAGDGLDVREGAVMRVFCLPCISGSKVVLFSFGGGDDGVYFWESNRV